MKRFWDKVDVRGPNDCWEWRGAKTRYGHFRLNTSRMVGAHRFAFGLGRIPAGMCVLHHCDNPPCCNPAHLFLGTHADNTADKVAKNRQPIGETHGKAKLLDEDVVEIRSLAGVIPQKQIAHMFGTNQQNVSMIVRGDRRSAVEL